VLDADFVAACAADPDPLVQAAGFAHRAGAHRAELDLEAAWAACEQATELAAQRTGHGNPQLHWWVFQVRGNVLGDAGRFAEAQAEIHAAAAIAEQHQLWPAWRRSIAKLVWIARRAGDSGEMVALLRRLVGTMPADSHDLNSALGRTLVWLGRPVTGLGYLRRCLDHPASPHARIRDHQRLASVLSVLDRHPEAAAELELARQLHAGVTITSADRYQQALVEFEYALAVDDQAAAHAAATAMVAATEGTNTSRSHAARTALLIAQVNRGDDAAAAASLTGIDPAMLGADHRAQLLTAMATLAKRGGDWEGAAAALGEVYEIVSRRHLAMTTLLQIEAELAARPAIADVGVSSQIAEFDRAMATRDEMLLAAAKDLRGPIATFEMGADLLARGEVDSDRIERLLERGAAEMQLLLEQLADLEPAELRPAVRPEQGSHDLLGGIGRAVARAWRAVEPVAVARQIGLVAVAPLVAVADAERLRRPTRDPARRALTTLMSVAVRAARPGSSLIVAVDPSGQGVQFDVDVEPGTPGATAVEALTAPAAGAPSWWLTAERLLATVDRTLTAEWTPGGRARVTLGPPLS